MKYYVNIDLVIKPEEGDELMSLSATFAMILGIVITWGLPLAIIISIIILFKKVNSLEKNIEDK